MRTGDIRRRKRQGWCDEDDEGLLCTSTDQQKQRY